MPDFSFALDCRAVAWFCGLGPIRFGPANHAERSGTVAARDAPAADAIAAWPTGLCASGAVKPTTRIRLSPPGQSTWPPPGQPAMQPTTPYVPSDQSVYPGTTPYVPSDQAAYPPPGPYVLAPAQPVYPPPALWLGAAEPWPGADTGACQSALGPQR